MALCPAAIAAFVFMLDTAVKQSVEERVGAREERCVCKNRIVIRKVYNRGRRMELTRRASVSCPPHICPAGRIRPVLRRGSSAEKRKLGEKGGDDAFYGRSA